MPSPYDQQNQVLVVESSRIAFQVLVEACDSLHPIGKMTDTFDDIIKQRASALLITEQTAYFFKSQLKVVPGEAQVQSMKFLRRVLWLLVKNNNSQRLRLMMRHLTKLLKKQSFVDTLGGDDKLLLQKMSCRDIFNQLANNTSGMASSSSTNNNIINGEIDQQMGPIYWRQKVARYFAYSVDGGLLYQDFNITQMMDLMKNLEPRDLEEIKYVISLMLYFRRSDQDYTGDTVASSIFRLIESTSMPSGGARKKGDSNKKATSSEINTRYSQNDQNIMKNQNNYEETFVFNQRVMQRLIEHDWFKNHLNDPYTYTKFFNFILTPDIHWSSDRLRAAVLQKIIDLYAESQTIQQKAYDEGDGGGMSSGTNETLQLGIVEPTINLYHKSQIKRLCILAASALYRISAIDSYRMFMLRQGLIPAMMQRLNSSDPTIVEYSLLLMNSVTMNKDACALLFIDIPMPVIIQILLTVIKGIVPDIMGAYYSAKSATYALTSLYSIAKLHHKSALQNDDRALQIIVSRLNSSPYQPKMSLQNAIESEKFVYLLLQTLARGSSPAFKDKLAVIVMPKIIDRIKAAQARGEEVSANESSTAMLAYLKTQTKDSSEAVGIMAGMEQFLLKARGFKKNAKLAVILLQRLAAVY